MIAVRHSRDNADDFGAPTGVSRGILDCHTRGVVTSASLMVTGRAVDEVRAISRDHPTLAIGLHWDVWGEDEREFDIDDLQAVRDEFHRQLDEFHRLLGQLPNPCRLSPSCAPGEGADAAVSGAGGAAGRAPAG